MKPEEYDEKVKELEKKHKKEKGDLMIEFADANNPYKEGDIIKDELSGTIIKIDKISYHSGFHSKPHCIYHGPELKKDLTPKKSGNKNSIYQDTRTINKLN